MIDSERVTMPCTEGRLARLLKWKINRPSSVTADVTRSNSMIVFLDFDGVLRRDSSPPSCFQTDCLTHFESAIRPFDDIEIVISSTWRVAVSLNEIRRFFSSDIGPRIIGSTPELDMEMRHQRFCEIIAYLDARDRKDETWLAIDDSPELFPADAPVLITQSDQGFNGECALRLRQTILTRRNNA